MKKTLEEILSGPVNIEDLIRTKKVIDKLIEKSKEAEGIEWPELEEGLEEEEPDHCICGHCDGTGCYICNYSGELYR